MSQSKISLSTSPACLSPPALTALGFAQGFSAAAFAETTTIPLDTLKVRRQLDPFQLRYKGSYHAIKTVLQEEGGGAFYNGLAAGCMRAGTIYACRLGIYETALREVASLTGTTSADSIGVKLLTAIPVTFISMVVGNPWDVLKVRAQRAPTVTTGVVPKKQPFSVDPRIIMRIVHQEGILGGLYAGFAPNLTRNMIVGSSELVAYYQTKHYLIETMDHEDTIGTHIMASAVAGLTAAVLGSPMDAVASRVMQADVVAAGISWPAYSLRMAKEEGFMAFYKGFGFNWARLTGFNLALFVSFEQIKKLCGAPAV